MLRRGLKRKIPSDENDSYQSNLSQFQVTVRRRESIRVKNQTNATPAAVERQIQNKIQVEQSLCEGTARFLLACGSSRSQACLEAAKNLQLSRLRIGMLKYEGAKMKRGRGSPKHVAKEGQPSSAGVSLSDLRLPLMWRRKDHINDVGESRKFAVFAIARIGSQIYDTTLMSPIDRDETDITFPDTILFSGVPAYFELQIEVYCHLLKEQDAIQEVITKTPKKIYRSLSRAVGKNVLTKALSKEFDILREDIGPKFDLIASASLTLDDCSDDVQSFELYIDQEAKEVGLPLFGQFCCRLAGRPYCVEEKVLSGPLVLQRQLKRQTLFGRLMNWRLSLWTDRCQMDAARQPTLEIPINRDTGIADKDERIIAVRNGSTVVEFAFEEKEYMRSWLVHLIQHAADHKRWKQLAVENMQVLSPNSKAQNGPRPFKRTRSKLVMLYNDL